MTPRIEHESPDDRARARRLEQVRQTSGYESLKAFHRVMSEGRNDVPSYASVRNYHWKYGAPVSYFVLVSEVFGVDLRWLITGNGEMYPESDDSFPEQLTSAVASGTVGKSFRSLSPEVRRLFFDLLDRYVRTAPDGYDALREESISDEVVELARDLYFLVGLPIHGSAWGFTRRAYQSARQLDDYATAMIHALAIWIENRGEGNPLRSARRSPIRIARRAVAEAGVSSAARL